MWAGYGEAPTNPHYDVYLLQWHKLFLSIAERLLVEKTSLTGIPYWDVNEGTDALYASEPNLTATGCPRIPLPSLDTVLAGLINTSSYWPDQRAAIDDFHEAVHAWFCAIGYGPCKVGALATEHEIGTARTEVILSFAPNMTDAEVSACLEVDVVYPFLMDSAYFWALHTYLDSIFERWQASHGYGAACSEDQGIEESVSDGVQNLAPPHPDACVSEAAAFEHLQYSYRDMCRPLAEWNIRYE